MPPSTTWLGDQPPHNDGGGGHPHCVALADNARTFLGQRVSIDAQHAAVVLPIQLLWHSLDLGRTPHELLGALLPLLPAKMGSALEALLKLRPRAIQVSYQAYSWDLRFKVGSGKVGGGPAADVREVAQPPS